MSENEQRAELARERAEQHLARAETAHQPEVAIAHVLVAIDARLEVIGRRLADITDNLG